MEFFRIFLNEYGVSFIMMIVLGFVIAFTTEIAVKKTFEYLGKKLGEKGAYLPIAKAVCIQVFTIAQTVMYTKLLVSVLPLPGGAVFFPVWLSLVYLIQYAFSLLGFGRFIEWVKNRATVKAQKREEEEANKPKLDPVEGHKGLYRNTEGQLVDKFGRLI